MLVLVSVTHLEGPGVWRSGWSPLCMGETPATCTCVDAILMLTFNVHVIGWDIPLIIINANTGSTIIKP